MQRVLSTICLDENRRTHAAATLKYLFENERLLKVAASYVLCKCPNISETVPDRVVNLLLQTTNRK